MHRRSLPVIVSSLLLCTWVAQPSAQTALTVVSAGPTGEVATLEEANEIRLVFSEPMVQLGRIPQPVRVPFVTIAPAIPGAFRWSGTTVLIFTPAHDKPLPHATRYRVTVGTTARSVAGRQLAKPYTFEFTTPTVKLQNTRWYRKAGRYDRAVVIALSFNQPVRAADVVTHATLRAQPHEWEAPTLAQTAQQRLRQLDPASLQAFDAKVAAVRAVVGGSAPIQVRVATDWDKTQFPASPDLVVLETTTAVPPDTWIEVTLDTALPSRQGKATPAEAQSFTIQLEATFFANGTRCATRCDPSGWNPVHLRREVTPEAFRTALTVTDVTTPRRPATLKPSKPASTEESDPYDETVWLTLEDAGYDRQPPARTYEYQLARTLTAEDGQTLGYRWLGTVENWHERAFTSFGDGHGVWESDGGSQLPFYSRNFVNVTQWIQRLLPTDLMPLVLRLQSAQFGTPPDVPGSKRQLAPVPDKTQSYGLDISTALPSGKGLVWAAVKEGDPIARARGTDTERTRATIVQVTNLGISVKDSPHNTLVFVTRLDNGEPVSGAKVSIVKLDNSIFWAGTTNTEGIVVAPRTNLRDPREVWKLAFIVTAEKDGDVAYVSSDWNEGVSPWEFGSNFDLVEAEPLLRGSVFTDRGVYRLGEEIHVKAILRRDTATGIQLLPANTPVHIVVTDSENNEIDRRSVRANEWSATEWVMKLPVDGSLGNYSITASLEPVSEPPPDAEGSWWQSYVNQRRRVFGSFLVAAYRRPDFRVDTKLSSDDPIAGASLKGVVSGRYLFGGAMAARPVKWNFWRSPQYSAPAAVLQRFPAERFTFVGWDEQQRSDRETVGSSDATLTTAGELSLDLETRRDAGIPYEYRFEGEVEDVSRQRIANSASLVVHPASVYVGVKNLPYFNEQKKGLQTEIVAVTPYGQVEPGVKVTVALTQIQWHSIRRAEGNGFYAWETERKDVAAGTREIVTGDQPVPFSMPLSSGGYFQLRATATDAQGRSTVTTTSFYALGEGYTAWARYDHNRIDLVPERSTYKPGETARIMVQSPWEKATALVTTEREGVRTHRRFALTSTQQTIDVSLSENDIPNVFVSVLLIKGRTKVEGAGVEDGSDPGKPTFRLGYTELNVEDGSKRLTMTVSANKEEYRPANAAKVAVQVKDQQARAARSEVTLWAVDYGVLSLTAYRTPDVLGSVYVRKALQVMNSDNRQRIIDRRAITPKGTDEGGGGGLESGAGQMRKDFRVLAFWIGSVVTDANGRAEVDVKLPESLTTYRIMAVANDKSSRFGAAESEIRINKPVLLRPAFPRFLAMGDRVHFGSVVNNQLPKAGTAVVTMRSLDPTTLEISGETKRSVPLAANGSAEVRFDAIARSVGRARVQMTVRFENETDAFEDVVPVEILSSPETVAAYGQTQSEARERITIPQGVVPRFGGLRVEMASTAMVGLGEGARYLVEYPYGCAEQQGSRALALLLAADLGEAFKLPGMTPSEMKPTAQSTLRGLADFQCSNGGFAYWKGGCDFTSPYLTSYLLNVFRIAASLGYQVDSAMRERAYDSLVVSLAEPPPSNESWQPSYLAWQAFAIKVLVEGGKNQDSNINRIYGRLERMPIFGVAHLYDALVAKKESGARVEELRRRIANAILPEGGSAHVEELKDPHLLWLWSSDTRSTAIALGSLVRNSDDRTLVPQLVRWLMGAREKGRWGNTQENAWALEALVDYYRKYKS